MIDTLSYRPQSSLVSSTRSSQTTVINPSGSNSTQTENNCNTCVDDYSIPPCTGFSKDYSCFPSLNN
ncbi:hypothetical protein cce_0555 [Crocosphaera subtropica ATCC 51142]|uniref:Uncharacterized protein n=1 Tax=Crocosphaera subtropica (strain ATCC 51142 / BH68) TaxID=43989 RepID=B1WPC4_CROS5|nr:hypothetical protein [Crocosphaera subtropica]ACB49906.1 hypothetical protein cce_0555 [Crocosphaera subtropica ATCC 51142]